MDKIDRKIINSLQKNARASLKDLSKECFISSPAIAARINKLEKSGIINGYHSSIDIEKIGFHVRAFIQVQLEPRQKDEFYPLCTKHSQCGGVQLRNRRLFGNHGGYFPFYD